MATTPCDYEQLVLSSNSHPLGQEILHDTADDCSETYYSPARNQSWTLDSSGFGYFAEIIPKLDSSFRRSAIVFVLVGHSGSRPQKFA